MHLTLQYQVVCINTTEKCNCVEEEEHIFYLLKNYFLLVDRHQLFAEQYNFSKENEHIFDFFFFFSFLPFFFFFFFFTEEQINFSFFFCSYTEEQINLSLE